MAYNNQSLWHIGCRPAEVLPFILHARASSPSLGCPGLQAEDKEGQCKQRKDLKTSTGSETHCLYSLLLAKANPMAEPEVAEPVARNRDKNTAYPSYEVRELRVE